MTGTGWAPTGATPENVALIQSCVGDAIGIKAAGGIRSLGTLEQQVSLTRTYYHFCLLHRALRLPLSEPMPTKGTDSPKHR
jgi:deoxyribose-phosphate aldolase